jgi:tRNA (cytidine32/uridine32-2'-O)-methyltransferase
MTHNLRIVLLKTTHPGNIGATARAMKNMGLTELALVAPKYFPHAEATARCSGAEDILDNVKLVDRLEDAVADCNLILGTSSRNRSLPIPLLDVKEAALVTKKSIQQGSKVAVLFGQERTGLTNEELAICHYHLYIPSNPDFPSLNLAAAVQVIAYEFSCAFGEIFEQEAIVDSQHVTGLDMERFYEHLEETLLGLEFLDADNPRLLMRKLRRLFNRISLERNEMNILRGVLTAVNRRCR